MFGGKLDRRFAAQIVDTVLIGYASHAGRGVADG